MTVPTTRQVVPGAAVSIVLKADQRTGREVQGVVKDVLTRGDHHRGIKVRLADGRIGRVQRMYAGEISQAPLNEGIGTSGLPPGAAGADVHGLIAIDALPPRFPGRHGRFRDIRADEPLEAPQEQVDLGAYIVAPKKKKGKAKGHKARPVDHDTAESQNAAAEAAPVDFSSPTAVCPVCNSFEGDEAAVAHHVAEHFE